VGKSNVLNALEDAIIVLHGIEGCIVGLFGLGMKVLYLL
jgi:hypothetical protein